MSPLADPPPGFEVLSDILTNSQEAQLLQHLEALPFRSFEMRGVAAKRVVVHYGWDYGYETWQLTRAEPPQPFLLAVRNLVAALFNCPAEALEEVLVTRYAIGAGIGWHRDAPMFGELCATR